MELGFHKMHYLVLLISYHLQMLQINKILDRKELNIRRWYYIRQHCLKLRNNEWFLENSYFFICLHLVLTYGGLCG